MDFHLLWTVLIRSIELLLSNNSRISFFHVFLAFILFSFSVVANHIFTAANQFSPITKFKYFFSLTKTDSGFSHTRENKERIQNKK
jgi:hypothetical protein